MIQRLKHIIVLICLLSIVLDGLCANEPSIEDQSRHGIDSLLKVVAATKSDTVLCKAYNLLCRHLTNAYEYDSAIYYGKKSIRYAKKIKNFKLEVLGYEALTGCYYYTSKPNECLKYLRKAAKIMRIAGDSSSLTMNLANTGIILRLLGEYNEALTTLEEALYLSKAFNDSVNMARSFNNLANVHQDLGNMKISLNYNLKALAVRELLNDPYVIAISLANVGSKYISLGDLQNALIYLNRSVEIRKKHNSKLKLHQTHLVLAGIHQKLKRYKTAHDHFRLMRENAIETNAVEAVALYQSSLANMYLNYLKNIDSDSLILENLETGNIDLFNISEKLLDSAFAYYKMHNNKDGQIFTLRVKAATLLFQGSPEQARALLNTLLNSYDSTSFSKHQLRDIYDHLAECNQKLKNYKEALMYYQMFVAIKDSLYNDRIHSHATRKEMQYSFDRKEYLRKVEEDKKALIRIADEKRKDIIVYASIAALSVAILFLLVLYNRFKKIKEQKNTISIQRENLSKQIQQNTHGLNYAKRIQDAVLPKSSVLTDFFKESNILYLPRDIVSGDFYWFEKLDENKFMWAVADCTGHGVPGGFMSMIGVSLLNKIILESHVHDPGAILNELREGIIDRLNQEHEDNRDGLAITLCLYDKTNGLLTYAGAENDFVIIRNNESIYLPVDQQSISLDFGREHFKDFQSQTIPTEKGDVIYMYTDGFPDQKGGPKNKKFMIGSFRAFLVSISQEPMNTQADLLKARLSEWKHDTKQLDDIAVFGVKI